MYVKMHLPFSKTTSGQGKFSAFLCLEQLCGSWANQWQKSFLVGGSEWALCGIGCIDSTVYFFPFNLLPISALLIHNSTEIFNIT